MGPVAPFGGVLARGNADTTMGAGQICWLPGAPWPINSLLPRPLTRLSAGPDGMPLPYFFSHPPVFFYGGHPAQVAHAAAAHAAGVGGYVGYGPVGFGDSVPFDRPPSAASPNVVGHFAASLTPTAAAAAAAAYMQTLSLAGLSHAPSRRQPSRQQRRLSGSGASWSGSEADTPRGGACPRKPSVSHSTSVAPGADERPRRQDALAETARGPRLSRCADADSPAPREPPSAAAAQAVALDILSVCQAREACAASDLELRSAEAHAALLRGSSLWPLPLGGARFFVVKSFSEDDVHSALLHRSWSSTAQGNRRLADAWAEAQSAGLRVFLLFSVNSSGQFCCVAEQVSSVSLSAPSADFWQQAKWGGHLALRWHCVKDVPNSALRHILMDAAPAEGVLPPRCLLGKPVTNSRDVQQLSSAVGMQLLQTMVGYPSTTSLIDDFAWYRARTAERECARAQEAAEAAQAARGT